MHDKINSLRSINNPLMETDLITHYDIKWENKITKQETTINDYYYFAS